MIVLEGPDGAGKTTLLEELKSKFGLEQALRASSSLGGPVSDLRRWVTRDLIDWSNLGVRVYDRHPLVSDLVYGPILRHTVQEGFMDYGWLMDASLRFRRQALVIFCLPPLPTVLANIDADPQGQMAGVTETIRGLYWGYHVMAATWNGTSRLYDYTRPDSLSSVLEAVADHLENW